jgi:hypothetical protein
MKERPLITLSKASLRDAAVLAEMNRRMIADEGHKGKLSLPKLKNRIRYWLRSGECEAVFFLDQRLAGRIRHLPETTGCAVLRVQRRLPVRMVAT